MKRSTQFGNLIYNADLDLLAAGVLYEHKVLGSLSFYHLAQAIEKYLKVLLIDINYKDGKLPVDQAGNTYIPYQGHRIDILASKLPNDEKYNFYKKDVINKLEEYSKYNEALRYAIVDKEKKVDGISSDELKIMGEIILKLRNEISIVENIDDYPLGMAVRGCHFRSLSEIDIEEKKVSKPLEKIFPNLSDFVRFAQK